MLGFKPKLPVSDADREWVDKGFLRLEKVLKKTRLLQAKIILPTPEYFPDRYDKTPTSVENLFKRVCSYMDVDCNQIELEIFADEIEELREILPHWRGNSSGCAGLYIHDGSESNEHKLALIAIQSTQLNDPLSLVATIAHELGHFILLGGNLIERTTPDHEPLTDLLTVYLGLGIFTANSANRFSQYQEGSQQGWSIQRLGYLPEEVYGYALAKFAVEREENDPKWSKHLSTNVRAHFQNSYRWLKKNTVQS